VQSSTCGAPTDCRCRTVNGKVVVIPGTCTWRDGDLSHSLRHFVAAARASIV